MNQENSALTPEERQRYHRQILLPQIGESGQLKLKNASVLIVGLGGLGSAAALYLAAAGVGRLGLADHDRVEHSNLQRQIVHTTDNLGQNKADSAETRLRRLNPEIAFVPHHERIDQGNAERILSGYDLALGCVDNFAARYALNRACIAQGKPNIFGSAARLEGQASVFCLPGGPCYQCFFQEPPPADHQPTREEQAVLGPAPGIVGCIQANEALKLLLGIGNPLGGRLLLYDGLDMSFREIAIRRDPACPACGADAIKKGKNHV